MTNSIQTSTTGTATATKHPSKRRKLTTDRHQNHQEQLLIPGLPDHVAQLCLSLVHPCTLYPVCHSWRRLIYSLSFPPFLSLYAVLSSTNINHSLSNNNPIQSFNFDPISSKWDSLPPPPQDPPLHLLLRHPCFISRDLPIQFISACGRLILIAATSHNFSPALSHPLVFNPLSSEWGFGPPLTTPRRWCAAGSAKDTVYVASGIGSQFNADVSKSVEKWDLQSKNVGISTTANKTITWKWEKVKELKDGRFCRDAIDAVGWRGKLYMVNMKGDAPKEGLVYDTEKDAWENMPEGMLAGWRGPVASMDEETMFVVDEARGVLRKYDPERDYWEHMMESERLATLDPFRNDTPNIEGLYELIKIVICLPIAIVRLVLFGVCLATGYVATKIALLGWKDKHNPMPKWRSRLMWLTRGCTRCILFSFGYHWIKRKGKLAPREIAPIVVSNHVSYIDPIFYFFEFFPTIVAAESHDSMPFVGTIIRAMQVIYVNRFSPSSRKLAVNEIKRKASCGRFPRVLLFPEGTTTNGKVLISFQLGAFIPGYAVQPVIVRYPHVHFDQSWGNVSLGMLMFRMFTQFHNFMEVEYLPIVSPLDNCKENPSHFAKRTSHAIASALNVVQTNHSYGDLMLLMKASELKQEKPSSYMVEMAKVESLFHINSLEAVNFLDKFLSMNPDASGRVKFNDFLRAFRLRTCTLSEELFGFLDVEKNGSITFKQFLYGSAHVMKRPLFHQSCELAFAQCDTRGHNQISEQELGDTIRHAIPDFDEDEIHELFSIFDMDGDGSVSKDNFLYCLRLNPLLIALFKPCLVHKDSSQVCQGILEEIV